MKISKWRKVVAVGFACAVAGAFSAPAMATPPSQFHPKPKCNSGDGNGSEPLPTGADCDPGNSGGNNGGD